VSDSFKTLLPSPRPTSYQVTFSMPEVVLVILHWLSDDCDGSASFLHRYGFPKETAVSSIQQQSKSDLPTNSMSPADLTSTLEERTSWGHMRHLSGV
jgi:hypothetical protein